MQRIEFIKRKIKSVEDLGSIVRTMKVLAAVSIRQYEEAADSVQQYFKTVEMGLQILLKNLPAVPKSLSTKDNKGKPAFIIFGAGQPMCGQFNEVLVSYVAKQILLRPGIRPDKIIAVGDRVAANLENHGLAPDGRFQVPASVSAINDRVYELVLKIEKWYFEEEIRTVVLFNNRPVTESTFVPAHYQLLPVDRDWLDNLKKAPWPSRSVPVYHIDPDTLLNEVLRQHFFVGLYKSFAESLSSEFGSRLAAMQMAEKKIEDELSVLQTLYREKRQGDITEEILDIMAGFEALSDESDDNTLRFD